MRERESERDMFVQNNADQSTMIRILDVYIYMESWRVQHHKHLMSSESSD